MKRSVALATLLALSVCACVPLPIIGGGIAGAGMDTSWAREAVESYRGFTSPGVSVLHGEDRATVQQDRRDLLHRFTPRILVTDEGPMDFVGARITFRNQHIRITTNNKIIVEESIPSVFYFSGLQVTSVEMFGETYLLLLTYSRASTGRVWIGFYRSDGAPMYLAAVSRGEIWDIVPSEGGFTLLGHSRSTQVKVSRQ